MVLNLRCIIFQEIFYTRHEIKSFQSNFCLILKFHNKCIPINKNIRVEEREKKEKKLDEDKTVLITTIN